MNKSHYKQLRGKWAQKQKNLILKLREKHKQYLEPLIPKQHIIGAMMLAATPFLTVAPSALQPSTPSAQMQQQTPAPAPTPEQVSKELKQKLPNEVGPLDAKEEKTIADILSTTYHIKVSPQLNGIRLNTTYGIIGKEQHLARFPGDTVYDQAGDQTNQSWYVDDGMAPGLGAWGYFAQNKQLMTTEQDNREKYYIAVQTFLAPGWAENSAKYSDFFKYRKMLVVNPDNGKAIVADIADAGPAPWTGKHLGGSPEVMQYLERVDGAQRGSVLYFFVDDPHDTIPLGPLTI